MGEIVLQADCSRCAGLCCIALAFDRSDKFAFDKAGGEPCRHLTPAFGCAIHRNLAGEGFSGCAQYDCLGAGQRVVQEIFQGRNWRDEPRLTRPMLEAFRMLRKVHDLIQLLQTAQKLPLTPAQEQQRTLLYASLTPQSGWSVETLRDFEIGPVPKDITAFLQSLKEQAALSRAGLAAGSSTRPAPSST